MHSRADALLTRRARRQRPGTSIAFIRSPTMRMIHKLVGTLVLMSMSSGASLAAAQTAAEKKAADFRGVESEMQQESTNMPSSSPPVDKTAPAADPIPKATTKAERAARFAD